MFKIAVLMTVYNRKQATLQCLYQLNQQKGIAGSTDVYLTDDGCTDGTPDAVKERFPGVKIIQGDGNLYWNRGMWTAWNEAGKGNYDYYLWLNDDTFLYENALSTLLKVSKSKNDKAIIIGAAHDKNHSTLTYGGRIGGKIPEPDGNVIEVEYFNGNIVLIPRSVYLKVGNLDYYFNHSKGDFDYGLRAGRQGIKAYQAGEVLGVCDAHEQLDKWCDPNYPLYKRWKAMWLPNGMPPHETFHFEKRHYGVLVALYHYCTIYLRCMMPKLWIIKNSHKSK